ncbi:uncharacterized protein LOC143753751 [Siphateles boraxobius]|uniref:uncharacterized protein LOC143753751 n=1 Tax=Siphateles boraxobius TaxID=180520 RepID=UPI0040643AA0
MLQFKSQTMMPFFYVPARNPSGIHSYCLLFLFALDVCLGGKVPDAVKVRDTAIIPCNETCNGNLLWELKTKNEKLDVLQCGQGTCTEGDSFKNRASFSEKFKAGNLSLKLDPVLYNDEGWYKVSCDSKFLCRFHLEVFVPTTVNATIRSNVTLPCYARTEKQLADDAVNVLWKKDDQTVLQVQKGITSYGSSFTGRATVSLHHYKDGDLSLTIFWVTPADKGLYRCYHNTEEEHGHPGAVTLNVIAHQKFYAKKFGDNLTLDLFGSDLVTVTFSGSTENLVCRVSGNDPECSPEYTNRVSVVNYSLVLGMLTSSDRGTFTVKDKMGEVISTNTVTVEGVTQRYYYVAPLSVLAVFVLSCICLFFGCHRKSQANANESTGVTEPLREPAYIGLSQQETSPNIPEESDICTHTPVEETMPVMVTSEKQDNTEEEESLSSGVPNSGKT